MGKQKARKQKGKVNPVKALAKDVKPKGLSNLKARESAVDNKVMDEDNPKPAETRVKRDLDDKDVKPEAEDDKASKKDAETAENNQKEAENSDDYDEEEDDDYDPESKKEAVSESESEAEEAAPDYSAVTASVSSVRTRSQRDRELPSKQPSTLVIEDSGLDIASIFNDLKERSKNPHLYKEKDEKEDEKETTTVKATEDVLGPEQIRIETSYAFAGKVITELKMVDADSAEAKAYLSSTSALTVKPEETGRNRSSIPVIRKLPNSEETIELRIKLKRPSLIDKFLGSISNKRLKLSTLEKSRLDWASFVDKRKLKDELTIHNKAGYLDKQDFLGRLDAKRDEQFVKAREENRAQQWQQQQQQQ